MKIEVGASRTKYGPGVLITLDSNELAMAVDHWLHAQGFYVHGPRTVRIDGGLISGKTAEVYVDPSGFVIHAGIRYSGNEPK